tara:strand:- start:762 stop:902 length:141 start_codon:yes stop_codon:yes gene_type:complete
MEEVNLNSSKSQIEFNKFSPKRNSSGWNIQKPTDSPPKHEKAKEKD